MPNTAGYLKVKTPGTTLPVPALKFADADKFEENVEKYFDSISIHEEIKDETGKSTGKFFINWIEPPTIVGLANFLSCDYRIFQDYESDKYLDHVQMTSEKLSKIKHTLAHARQICHQYTLRAVYTSKSAHGPIFLLKTVYKEHGYQEELNINQSHTIEDKKLSLDKLPTEDLMRLEQIITKTIDQKQFEQLSTYASDADYEDVDNDDEDDPKILKPEASIIEPEESEDSIDDIQLIMPKSHIF